MLEPPAILQRQATVTDPARHSPLPAVKRETAKLVRDVLEQTPKAVVTKLRDRCGCAQHPSIQLTAGRLPASACAVAARLPCYNAAAGFLCACQLWHAGWLNAPCASHTAHPPQHPARLCQAGRGGRQRGP